MLDEMVGPAMRNLEGERARIEELLRADGVEGPVQPWDWAYYAARDKAATYDVDTNAVKPVLRARSGCSTTGSSSPPRCSTASPSASATTCRSYAEDVRVFEVRDGDGSTLGLFVCDWFARPTKQGGAWMDEFVGQSHLLGTPAGRGGLPQRARSRRPASPALMTIDEVRTGFHEFGHALHGLFSDTVYPRLQGTAVPRDFVEFPSQVNEMWAWWPEVLANYAVHHETGEPLAQDVVDRLVASQAHGQGFEMVAMLGAALLDQEWHLRTPARAGRRPPTTSRRSRPGPGAARRPLRPGAAALPQRLLRARLRRRVRRGLLLLPVERGARRGHGRLVHRERRADPRERGPVPRASCCRSAAPSTRSTRSPPCGAARPSTEPLLRRRGLRG